MNGRGPTRAAPPGASPGNDADALRRDIYRFSRSLALKVLGADTWRLSLRLLLEPLNY